jgi:eukaryotic-like serine/threonine-protein kinase
MNRGPQNDDDLSPSRLVEINRICDRFEEAWRTGRRPAIEDYLAATAEPMRSDLLRELLAVELEWRRSAGERPGAQEYRARFPTHVALVEAACAKPGRAATPPSSDPGRNLLFGLLALQNNFIDRDALLAAFNAWITDKSRSLGDLLRERGAIDDARHALVSALVGEHLKLHGGDAERSLAALTVGDTTREALRKVGDAGLDASLSHAGAAVPASGDVVTTLYAVDPSSGQGRRFRVLRPHAQGGLGAVFVALDNELNREVAVKQIHPHLADDAGHRARFIREAEITGALEHPGIVPVYSLGRYSDGRPYYVMRLIRGESLKTALNRFHSQDSRERDPGERALALRQLLRRFLDVCNTVAYTHSRGVLHRDLKPDNIMLGPYGETMVVDWGLTKLAELNGTDPDAPEEGRLPRSERGAELTLLGSTVGTPAYMSPEQASGGVDRLGPACDVYGLGTTLYCLLTGRAPFEGANVKEVLDKVRRGEFPPPCRLNPEIDRALEAICLRAMALAPQRRYESARALADDVEHWMADEPVTACRESRLRRARRWARRHRTAVTAVAAALVVALTASLAIAAIQSVAAKRQQHLAERERTARALAQARLGQVEKANDLLGSIFADLNPFDETQGGQPLRAILGERLSRAAASMGGDAIGDPLTVAKLQQILGASQANLGNAAEAITLLTRSAETRAARLGRNHPDTLMSKGCLASAYLFAGRTSDAIALYEETLAAEKATMVPDDERTLSTCSDLAEAYLYAGRMAEAIELHEKTLRRREELLGADHSATLISRDNLGTCLYAAGRWREAVALFETTHKLLEKKLGPDHVDTLLSGNNLAAAYNDTGRPLEAVALLQATLKAQNAKLGALHPHTLITRHNLARAYRGAGRVHEAIELFETTLKAREARLGTEHPDTFRTRSALAATYRLAGRTADAIALLESIVRADSGSLGPDQAVLLLCRVNLAVAYCDAGRTQEAIPLLQATIDKLTSAAGADHPDNLWARGCLGGAYLRVGNFAAAEPLVVASYEGLALKETTNPPGGRSAHLAEAAERVLSLYRAWGKPEQTARWKTKLGLADLPADVFAPAGRAR